MEKISSKICLNTKRKNSFSSFFCKHFFLFVLVTIILWGGVAILPAAARTTPQIISDCKKQSSVQSTINDCVSAAVNAENPVNSAWKDGLKVAGKVVVKGIDTMVGLATMPQYLVLSAWLLIISGIANTFLFLVAMIFDAFLSISMNTFGSLVDGAGVYGAWEIIRNTINISFIFILLYIAISMILGSFGPKKKSTVAGVIVSALLINFSLFIARLVVDFGNIIAVAIYNKSWSGPGITAIIMGGLQLETLFSPDILTVTGQANAVILSIIQIILSVVLQWTLLYGIIFMLGRIVMIIALLAISPIGFVGMSIPWLKEKADDWWSALINQVFLLPIFMFFMMMANTMLKGSATLIGFFDIDLINMDSLTGFKPSMWIYYCLIIGMLLMSIKMTKKMSGKVGDIADKIVKGVKVAAAAAVAIGASVATGGAAAGPAAAMVGRMATAGGTGLVGKTLRTVGGGIQRVARSPLGTTIQTSGARVGGAARGALGQPGIIGDLARSTQKSILGAVKDYTGLGIADANKDIKDYQKNYTKFAGEQATKIGPAEIDDEIKRREDTMANITARAIEELGPNKQEKAMKESQKKATETTKKLSESIKKLETKLDDPTENKESKAKLIETLEKEKVELVKSQKNEEDIKQAIEKNGEIYAETVKAKEKEIGQGMGYDTSTHTDEMAALKKDRITRAKARDQYLSELGGKGEAGKKAAAILRASKDSKFKSKSAAEEMYETFEKEYKKNNPSEEKKEVKSEPPSPKPTT